MTFASLSLKGSDLNPHEVTDVLGVAPTLAYRKGERFVPNTQRKQERHRKLGLWLFSTEKAIECCEFQDHLDRIAALLKPSIRVRRLLQDGHLVLSVGIFWFGPAGQPQPVVPESFRRLVREAGGELDLDFGESGDEDDHCAA